MEVVYEVFAGCKDTGEILARKVSDRNIIEEVIDDLCGFLGWRNCCWGVFSGESPDNRVEFAKHLEREVNGDKHYVNGFTGEVTYNRDTAMQWYRDGSSVECWKDGRNTITLNSMGI